MEAFDMKRQCSYVMCVSVEVIAGPSVGALRVFTVVDTWYPKIVTQVLTLTCL